MIVTTNSDFILNTLVQQGILIQILKGKPPHVSPQPGDPLTISYELTEAIPISHSVSVQIGTITGQMVFHLQDAAMIPKGAAAKATKCNARYAMINQEWSGIVPDLELEFKYDNDFRDQDVISPEDVLSYFDKNGITLSQKGESISLVCMNKMIVTKTCKVIPASFTFSVTMKLWSDSYKFDVLTTLQDANLATPTGDYRLTYSMTEIQTF